MNRLYTFISFSVYQLILFVVAVPIVLFIIYTLSMNMPGRNAISERGIEVAGTPSFNEWLNGSGDNRGIVNGDFGMSFRMRQPAGEVINQRLPASLELIRLSLALSVVIGMGLAVVLVLLRQRLTDGILSIPLILAGSIPVFCLALVLVLQFAFRDRVFPVGGLCPAGSNECDDFMERLPYLVLPISSMVIIYASGIALYLRDAILRYARQEGTTLTLRHVIAGLLIFTPVAVFGTLVGMVSSLPIIEAILGYPGAGRLLVDAAFSLDLPVLVGTLVMATVALAVVYLIAMIVYGLMIALFPVRPPAPASVSIEPVEVSPFRQRLRRLSFFGAVVAALVLAGIAGVSFTASGDPAQTNVAARLSAPDAEHPWGTDSLGRDYQTRVLHGGRVVVLNALTAGVIALVLTVILGVIGGLFGGVIGVLLNIPLNLGLLVLQLFPALLLLIFMGLVYPNRPELAPGVIAVLSLSQTVPVMRSAIQGMRSGMTVPFLSVLLYVLCLVMSRAVLLGAMLDFLGVGVQPPTPSWGNVLSDALQFLRNGDFLLTPPVALLTLTIFCLTFIYMHLHNTFGFLVPAQSPKAKRGDTLFGDVKTEDRDVLFSDVR